MYIGIDVGGTSTRLVGLDSLEMVAIQKDAVFQRDNTHVFEDDISFIVDSALEISKGQPIDAIGIGIPGTLNEDKKSLKSAKNLESWANQPIVDRLTTDLGCRVLLEHDSEAALLGELHYGDVQDDFDYVIWGTGVGGGAASRSPLPETHKTDWRELFAEWEEAVGGGELEKRYGKSTYDFTDSEWRCVKISFIDQLNRYMTIRQPTTIIFGGGLALVHSDLLLDINKELTDVNIRVTQFGSASGLYGAFGVLKRDQILQNI